VGVAATIDVPPPPEMPVAEAAPAPRFAARVAMAVGLVKPLPKYWVQVGAFRSTDAAVRLVGRMKSWALTIVTGPLTRALGAPQDSLARVLVGPYSQRADAVATLKRLQASGIAGFVAEDRR
jgi:cell division septation protein DedD